MPLTDTLLTRINETASLDPTAKSLLAAFVEANRAFLERLGPTAATTFLQAVFAGNPAPWDTLVAQMNQSELLALLSQAQSNLDTCIATRAAAIARLQGFTSTAADVALRLLANALLGLL